MTKEMVFGFRNVKHDRIVDARNSFDFTVVGSLEVPFDATYEFIENEKRNVGIPVNALCIAFRLITE